MEPNENKSLIEKKTLYVGTKQVTFKNGTKVFFHFQARLCDQDKTLLDDSRKIGPGKPIELVLGKKFKLEVWEVIVQKMALNEVAVFTIDKSLVLEYPFVSKTLRDAYAPKEHVKTHCCGMMLQNQGVGYEDLNKFLKDPMDIEFTFELLRVQQPDEYEKEPWQMSEEEKIKSIPFLKEQGNLMYKHKDYKEAEKLYAKAIGILEQLMMKEKPRDTEWEALNKQKLPLLLNYSQCKLYEGDFYAVIEHCNTVLESEPENVKALFRRAKGHIGAWNPEDAKRDFKRVVELDPSLKGVVKKELMALEEMIKEKDREDKEKFKNLF